MISPIEEQRVFARDFAGGCDDVESVVNDPVEDCDFGKMMFVGELTASGACDKL